MNINRFVYQKAAITLSLISCSCVLRRQVAYDETYIPPMPAVAAPERTPLPAYYIQPREIHLDKPGNLIIISPKNPVDTISNYNVIPTAPPIEYRGVTQITSTPAGSPTVKHNELATEENKYSLNDILRDLEIDTNQKSEMRDKVNSRKNNVDFLSVFDQGKSESDRNQTAKIRQALLADKNISYRAKNVVIITKDGIVTLQGVVSTEWERVQIINIAKRYVSPYMIREKILVGSISDFNIN